MLFTRHHRNLLLFTPFTHFLHICRLNAVTVAALCQNMPSIHPPHVSMLCHGLPDLKLSS